MDQVLFLKERAEQSAEAFEVMLQRENWMAAAAVAGVCVEALLLGRLLEISSGGGQDEVRAAVRRLAVRMGKAFPRRKLTNFLLSDVAKVSCEAGVIDSRTLTRILKFARSRGLLHAGAAVKRGREMGPDDGLLACAAVGDTRAAVARSRLPFAATA